MARAENRLGHLLWEAASLTRSLEEPALESSELRKASLGCLMQIAANPGITVSELARAGLSSQQSSSQVVARLERLQYVERRLRTGRRIGLYITATGMQSMLAGDAREAQFESELSELLGRQHYDLLCELLTEARARLRERRGVGEQAPLEP